ncbi:thioredoxin [Bacillus salipaludis]|uniref:Thioredoxin n=1 Tax=Bacillus salipaludis TaxID=2547811 RepID=A0A4R5VVP2_9BACI|nr:thioredoxin family protein [Bacillus salipaludis]MDQ6600233.1 thioredoxin family protein [Bacillus salipaludis]TDK62315.1 thioredoxin [Bacillus salipaludis]
MKEWNRDEFSLFIENKSTGLVYFYTPLCGTCQVASRMLQVIEQMVDCKMGKMNLNFYPDFGKSYGIESVPCLMFIHNGQVVELLYAFRSVPYLIEKINENLT